MAVDERARRDLHERLEETLGARAADTLMGALPPGGWDEVATKDDLAGLGIDAKFEGIDAKFEAIDAKFEAIGYRFDGLDERFAGLDARMEAGEHRLMAAFHVGLSAVRTDMAAQTKLVVFGLVAAVASSGGLVLAATQLG